MDKLKVIVSSPGFFASTDFSKYEEEINKAKKEGHRLACIEYLHGEVEHTMGYDIGACLNAELCIDFDKKEYIEGIYDVEVIDYPNPCKAYLWNVRHKPRGLIVDPTNEKDLQYAKGSYNKRQEYL